MVGPEPARGRVGANAAVFLRPMRLGASARTRRDDHRQASRHGRLSTPVLPPCLLRARSDWAKVRWRAPPRNVTLYAKFAFACQGTEASSLWPIPDAASSSRRQGPRHLVSAAPKNGKCRRRTPHPPRSSTTPAANARRAMGARQGNVSPPPPPPPARCRTGQGDGSRNPRVQSDLTPISLVDVGGPRSTAPPNSPGCPHCR